jgi:hypothetical protein
MLRLLDLVFGFGLTLHGMIMPAGSSTERPSAITCKRDGKLVPARANTPKLRLRLGGVDVKNPSGWQILPPGLLRQVNFGVIGEYRR